VGLIVTDASAIVDLLAADDPRRQAIRDRLADGDAVYAPAHLDIEVISALRALARRSEILASDAPALIKVLQRMPIRREPLTPGSASRVWQLRENMTAYDAGYVALAEQIGASLLTCDKKYTATPGLRCTVELIA
jgi:predicted nucleic acid-binding protein